MDDLKGIVQYEIKDHGHVKVKLAEVLDHGGFGFFGEGLLCVGLQN